MQKTKPKRKVRAAQHQLRPGKESRMHPVPVSDDLKKPTSGKLTGKFALITGGDSGIGKAVAILFAREGADVAIVYLNEHEDANETKKVIEEYGRDCMLIAGDVGHESFCKQCIAKTTRKYGRIDILVNNAGMHYESEGLEKISTQQLTRTFQVNIFSMFWITKYSLPYMQEGSCIINTASVTAYRGSGRLIDYAATKGAIVSFTRSLSANLAGRKIRVNGVAPGPVWTPLIASSFPDTQVSSFGSEVPMGRAGQPVEIAPCYLFLASEDSNYITGQFLHPNGGEIVNG